MSFTKGRAIGVESNNFVCWVIFGCEGGEEGKGREGKGGEGEGGGGGGMEGGRGRKG